MCIHKWDYSEEKIDVEKDLCDLRGYHKERLRPKSRECKKCHKRQELKRNDNLLRQFRINYYTYIDYNKAPLSYEEYIRQNRALIPFVGLNLFAIVVLFFESYLLNEIVFLFLLSAVMLCFVSLWAIQKRMFAY